MPLVNGRILSGRIQEKRVLAGASNTTNLETTISILDIIGRSGLPNFTQIASTSAQLSGYDYICEIMKRYTDKMSVPVSLHPDHGRTQEDARQVVRTGFISVMIDGAAFSLKENIASTQEAVDFCKSYDVPVETELGVILGKENDHVNEADCKTEPEKVKTFTERTDCDMLAVSIGNVHSLDDTPRVNIPLLKRIAEVSPVPLVIHGDSDIAPEILRSFVNHRVAKVNIANGLRKAFVTAVGKTYVNNHSEADLVRMIASVKNTVEEDMYSKVLMVNEGHRLDK